MNHLSLRSMPHRPTRLRAPLLEDRRGDDQPDWPAAVASAPFPARIEQQSALEQTEPGRQSQRTTWLLLTNFTDLLPTDRIVWDDETYEIDGAPRQVLARRRLHHLEATLMRVTG